MVSRAAVFVCVGIWGIGHAHWSDCWRRGVWMRDGGGEGAAGGSAGDASGWATGCCGTAAGRTPLWTRQTGSWPGPRGGKHTQTI